MKTLSSSTRNKLESEIDLILNKSYERVQGILNHKIKELHNLANALIERETLTKDEIIDVLHGKTLGPAESRPKSNLIPQIIGKTPTLITQQSQ